jgi:dihydroorotase
MTDVVYGYDDAAGGWWVPPLSNLHGHLRAPGDPRFPIAVHSAATQFRYYTAMPNLGAKDLIRSPEGALAYSHAIAHEAAQYGTAFTPIVPLYLEPDTTPETVERGFKEGAWISAKLYSKGATTASAEGVDFRKLEELFPVFKMMERLGMVLLIHLEPVAYPSGIEIDPWHRERKGLAYLEKILSVFGGLPVVFEHVSSQEGIEKIRERQNRHSPIEATIAPQYLVWTRAELLRGGMNPAKYSIPVLKKEEDRRALVDFLLDGGGFLGSDSAPHLLFAKSQPCGCAGGVFNDPVAVSVYFDTFRREGEAHGITDWFDRFVDFACRKGPEFYSLSEPEGRVLIKEEAWEVPNTYGSGKDLIIPMYAGETVPYKVVV